MPSWEIISGVADRLVMAILIYAVAKGWITQSDVAPLLALTIGILSALWGAYVNRPKALVQAAAAIPGTTVVTTPALAEDTPNQNNIVSSDDNRVVAKQP